MRIDQVTPTNNLVLVKMIVDVDAPGRLEARFRGENRRGDLTSALGVLRQKGGSPFGDYSPCMPSNKSGGAEFEATFKQAAKARPIDLVFIFDDEIAAGMAALRLQKLLGADLAQFPAKVFEFRYEGEVFACEFHSISAAAGSKASGSPDSHP